MGDEAVKVAVRCRPPNKKEENEGRKNCVDIDPSTGQIILRNPEVAGDTKSFAFDSVYDPDSTQKQVYEETAFPLVESVLSGYNGTIFAYGQTGSGKTWSMQGKPDPPELRGITPQAFEDIFQAIKNNAGSKEYLVRVAFLEIYNEELRDLLTASDKKLELRENPETGVYVPDLTNVVVDSAEATERVMAEGNRLRTVGATAMNAESSRSHSIFTVIIETSENRDGRDCITRGKLNLVDLAGSERISKTGATGTRMKEGIKINLSLTALGNVISALVEGKNKHIPYRDSKLTRLLQDSLGGNTKTVMLAAINGADYNYEETLSTLRYANRAKNIKNKPIVNEDPKDTLLRQYKEEIEKLKSILFTHLSAAGVSADAMQAILASAGMAAGGGGGGNLAAAAAAAAAAMPKGLSAPAAGGAGAPGPSGSSILTAAPAKQQSQAGSAAAAAADSQEDSAAAAAAASAGSSSSRAQRGAAAAGGAGAQSPSSASASSTGAGAAASSSQQDLTQALEAARQAAENERLQREAMAEQLAALQHMLLGRGGADGAAAAAAAAAAVGAAASSTQSESSAAAPTGGSQRSTGGAPAAGSRRGAPAASLLDEDPEASAFAINVPSAAAAAAAASAGPRGSLAEADDALIAASGSRSRAVSGGMESSLTDSGELQQHHTRASRSESAVSAAAGGAAGAGAGESKTAAEDQHRGAAQVGAGAAAGEKGSESPERRESSMRREMRIKQRQNLKQKQEDEKRKLEEEMQAIESSEAGNMRVETFKRLRSRLEGEITSLKNELQEAQDDWSQQRETLTGTILEQAREIKLLEQVALLFLTQTELGKVWEKAEYDEDRERWILPKIKPRSNSGWKQLGNRGGGGGGVAGGGGGTLEDDFESSTGMALIGEEAEEAAAVSLPGLPGAGGGGGGSDGRGRGGNLAGGGGGDGVPSFFSGATFTDGFVLLPGIGGGAAGGINLKLGVGSGGKGTAARYAAYLSPNSENVASRMQPKAAAQSIPQGPILQKLPQNILGGANARWAAGLENIHSSDGHGPGEDKSTSPYSAGLAAAASMRSALLALQPSSHPPAPGTVSGPGPNHALASLAASGSAVKQALAAAAPGSGEQQQDSSSGGGALTGFPGDIPRDRVPSRAGTRRPGRQANVAPGPAQTASMFASEGMFPEAPGGGQGGGAPAAAAPANEALEAMAAAAAVQKKAPPRRLDEGPVPGLGGAASAPGRGLLAPAFGASAAGGGAGAGGSSSLLDNLPIGPRGGSVGGGRGLLEPALGGGGFLPAGPGQMDTSSASHDLLRNLPGLPTQSRGLLDPAIPGGGGGAAGGGSDIGGRSLLAGAFGGGMGAAPDLRAAQQAQSLSILESAPALRSAGRGLLD